MQQEQLQEKVLELSLDGKATRHDEEAILAVRQRSIPSTILYILLFLVLVFATPLYRRYPQATLVLGVLIVLLNTFRLYWALNFKKYLPHRLVFWRKIFSLGLACSAGLWGLFCALILCFFELSWTSFFTVLLSSVLSAGSVAALAPSFFLLKWEIGLLLTPALFANLWFVGGLQGTALASFFFAFIILLLLVGKIHHTQYWKAVRDHSKVRAMVEALPGTLSWVSSELKYIGINHRLADLWSVPTASFVGKDIGFKEPNSYLVKFTKALFESAQAGLVKEFEMDIAGQLKTYLIVGQKYNLDSEAVILGIDLTEHLKLKKELHQQKAQSYYSAKLATLGEIASHIVDEIAAPATNIEQLLEQKSELSEKLPNLNEQLQRLFRISKVLRRFTTEISKDKLETVQIKTIIEEVLSLCNERFKRKGIELKVSVIESSLSISCKSNQLFQIVLNLLNNAFDAVKEQSKKVVSLDIAERQSEIFISVTDSGPGIPKELRQKIFEPLFTTKQAGSSTGIGLSISQEFAQANGGRLFIDEQAQNTCFVLALPKTGEHT